MQPFNLAVSCAFACTVFFGGVAPANYDPAIPKISAEETAAPPSTDPEAALPSEDASRSESESLSADAPPADTSVPRKLTSLERAKIALAGTTATPPSDHELCTTLVEVARNNDLPLGFFTNLIWQESRFDHDAISPVGAMGIAQFMPDVADKLSLDAFDTLSALPASARLLRTLRARFGNLGLAAAAYNAGPKRVADWLEKRSGLPKETQGYVQTITGRPAAHWQNVKPHTVVYRVPRNVPCHRLPTFASLEQKERAQQEQIVAEEARLAEQRAREAAQRLAAAEKERRAAEKEKRKVVARSARVQLASRVQSTKTASVRRPAVIRLAQVKR